MELQNILCAIDFSHRSQKALEYARNLTEKIQGKLYLVYVMQSLDMYEQFNVSLSFRQEYEENIADQAQKKMDKLIQEVANLYNRVDGYILKGEVAEQILQFVEDNNMDLIVVGTHGNRKINEILFGSVAEKIVKLSNIPVLTVKPQD